MWPVAECYGLKKMVSSYVNFLVKVALVACCQHISTNPQEEVMEIV